MMTRYKPILAALLVLGLGIIPLAGCMDSAGNTIGSAASHAYTETNITNNLTSAIWGGLSDVSGNLTINVNYSGSSNMTGAQIIAALGYTPEDEANKATSVSLGTSDTLYPSQNAVKSYVDTAVSGFTPLVTGNVTATAPIALDAVRMVIGGALNISIPVATNTTNGYLAAADWITFNAKMAALAYTPENVANKSDNTSLGTSTTLYPTENAVKSYVDTALTAKLATANVSTTSTAGKVAAADANGKLDGWVSGTVYIKCIAEGTALATGNGTAYFTVPTLLNGMNLVEAAASVYTVSSSGTPTIKVYNVTDSFPMLTTDITIDANELTSYTAATGPSIDTSHDDVATADQIRIDVSVAGTGTKGLDVILTFR